MRVVFDESAAELCDYKRYNATQNAYFFKFHYRYTRMSFSQNFPKTRTKISI